MPEPVQDIAAAYASLGLIFGADAATVKAAYRRLARGLHPDRNPDAPEGGMAALNAAHALLLAYLARPPRLVCDYRFDLWAPRTGQREFQFDTWAPRSAQGDYQFETFGETVPRRPLRPVRPAPAPAAGPLGDPAPAPLASAAGLGPLAGPAPAPPPDLAPARPLRREARPAPPRPPAPAPAGRLTGLTREGGAFVYRVEVSGRPDHVTIPVRWQRSCPACAGGGRRADGQGPCPACAGRGYIVAARLTRVGLPAAWRPGDRLSLAGLAPDQALSLLLVRPARPEA